MACGKHHGLQPGTLPCSHGSHTVPGVSETTLPVPSVPLKQKGTILEANEEMQPEVRQVGERTEVPGNISLAAAYICQVNYASPEIIDGHPIEYHPGTHSQH